MPQVPGSTYPTVRRRRTPAAAPAALLLALGLGGCTLTSPAPERAATPPDVRTDTVYVEVPAPRPAADTAGQAVTSAPLPGVSDPSMAAERTLASLTLREKVAQMIMPFVLGDFQPEGTPGHDRIVRMVEQGVGGVIVSVGTPADVAVKLNDLQRHAEVPLLVGADLETGAGFRMKGALHIPTNILLGGATDFPSQMAVGATGDAGLAYEMGRITAIEARAVGIHVPFAPVLDVNSNPDNPIISVRSFGEDPEMVSRLGQAYVRGVQEHGAIATGKHFPGHGDTDTDSHRALPTINADRARLDSLELRPFRDAIAAGIGGIMTAHITVPALNEGTGDPSTLSRPVLTGLLREEYGFDGLLFTDAMDMGAIEQGWGRQEATVRAVEAGADVILMPPSVETAIEAIEGAVLSGRLSEERIDRSVLRILETKERLGLFREPRIDIDGVAQRVGIPAHTQVAEEVARRSLTLVRNRGDLLPLAGTRDARVVSVTYRGQNDLLASRWFDANLRSTYPGLTTQDVLRDTDPAVYRELLAQARRSDLVVVSLHVSAWSSSGLPDELVEFVEDVEATGVPHVVIVFGNPYLVREIPDARSILLAWSGSEASQRAAVDALFGRQPITGRLPTRIPPLFEIGDGLQIPAVDGDGG